MHLGLCKVQKAHPAETLAILVALMPQYGEVPSPNPSRVMTVPLLADNTGNGALLNKLLTTKFPAADGGQVVATFKQQGGSLVDSTQLS